MNAAHAHVCASLLYKAKLRSNGPSDCQFIHLVSQRNSAINLQNVYVVLLRVRSELVLEPAVKPASEILLAREPSTDKERGNHS